MRFATTTILYLALCLTAYGQAGTLVWEDNFDEGELDLTKWSYEQGTGVNGDWGTGQLDRATSRPENVSFQDDVPGAEDGCLVITTRKEHYIDRDYTSGRIKSEGKSSWGPGHRIVARVFPRDVKYKGQGFAFWMMPDELPGGWDYIMWPQGGELDIMEYVGSVPYHNLGSVHYAWFWENNQWQSWNHGHQGFYYSFETDQVPNPSEPGYGGYPPEEGDPYAGSSGFHTYGIDWYADRIEFFTDDNVYHIHYLEDGGAFQVDGQDAKTVRTIENRRVGVSEYSNHFEEWYPFEHRMYTILSAGVGGQDHTYGGPIVAEAEFPCAVFIDWVRVYKLNQETGIARNIQNFNIEVIPNPVRENLRIQSGNHENFQVTIFDIAGRMLFSSPFRESANIDVSHLEKGPYIVLVKNNTRSVSKKIIIQ